MRYKTHLATTLAISLPLMVTSDSLSVESLSFVALGAVFPDIDEPHSYIGRRMIGISNSMKVVFGHRGLTHSLVGLFAAIFIFHLGSTTFGLPLELIYWFAFGYFAHLLQDSFSKKGIAWLQPFSKKRFQSGFRLIYYTTGGIIETLLFVIAILFLIQEMLQLNLSDFSFKYMNQFLH